MKPQILLIDDEADIRFGFVRYLSRAGYAVYEAGSLTQAREAVSGQRFDAILLDLNLPDGNGLDWIPELRELSPDVALVVITGEGDMPVAVEALRGGADHFLTKPVSMLDLDVFLRKSLELGGLRRVRTAHLRLADKDEPFFGSSAAIRRVQELASLAAENNSPVVLLGETGTGKGVLARWIYRHSALKSAPFVEVNCSGLRGELLASELFGHAKGAFTSAVQNQQGLLEVADGGTLFLDEIGDMDLAAQTQFLKVIEEKQYRRLGEVKVRKSNFRLICPTNRILADEIKQGKFRNDLYYRIFIFPIFIPPLRERKGDLNDLACHLLRQLGSNRLEIPDPVLNLFSRYSWPGNIREMKNLLERALLLSRGGELLTQHFSDLLQNKTSYAAPFPVEESTDAEDISPVKDDQAVIEVVLEALAESPAGLTRTEISGLFGHHKSAQEITRLFIGLEQRGLVRQDKIPTGGRPVERWRVVSSGE